VTQILNGVSTDELQHVFRSWIEHVENVITAEGAVHPSKYPACHYLMWDPVLCHESTYFLDTLYSSGLYSNHHGWLRISGCPVFLGQSRSFPIGREFKIFGCNSRSEALIHCGPLIFSVLEAIQYIIWSDGQRNVDNAKSLRDLFQQVNGRFCKSDSKKASDAALVGDSDRHQSQHWEVPLTSTGETGGISGSGGI
jgi:hypothetical protein